MEKLQSKKKTQKTGQSSKDKRPKETESEMDGTNIGEHITYDVLRMILEYSNIKDLTRAAMVCRSWNEAVKKEIHTRIRPQHILYEFDPKKKKNQASKPFTDQLYIKPSVGLLFVGKQVRSNIWQLDSPCVDINDCLCQTVPHQTNCITLWNYGLVYDNLEMEGNFVSGLFLPEIPGARIKFFHVSRDGLMQFRATTRHRNRDKLAREFCKISPNEENIKCIILFANQVLGEGSEDAKRIFKSFLSQRTNNEEDKISIWGGVSSTLTVCSHMPNGKICDRMAPLAGISICGAGISAWSMVLGSRIKTKVQAEKELTLFRDAIKLQKYSVGLMFACCGRGEDWYSEKDVEPKIFRKLFPSVPLVGSFGGGEFGLSTIPHECSKGTGIVHEYSTIFLILSYGSVRKMK